MELEYHLKIAMMTLLSVVTHQDNTECDKEDNTECDEENYYRCPYSVDYSSLNVSVISVIKCCYIYAIVG